jgi:hypothetical protein
MSAANVPGRSRAKAVTGPRRVAPVCARPRAAFGEGRSPALAGEQGGVA